MASSGSGATGKVILQKISTLNRRHVVGGVFVMAVIAATAMLADFESTQTARVVLKENTSISDQKASNGFSSHINNYGQLPLHFEQNIGQTDDQVKYLSRGAGYALYIKPTETVLALQTNNVASVIRMHIEAANPLASISGSQQLPGKINYLKGRNESDWHTNVSTYAEVRVEQIYPGIDLRYHGEQQQLEYDFSVSPGADPDNIRLAFDGINALTVNDAGDLVITTEAGELHHKKPIIYQQINGERISVDGRYKLLREKNTTSSLTSKQETNNKDWIPGQARHDDGRSSVYSSVDELPQETNNQHLKLAYDYIAKVGFDVGKYDAVYPLIIDPVIDYASYLGGEGEESQIAVAADIDGSVYVTGSTNSSLDYPLVNAQQITLAGQNDVIISKYSSDGNQLEYSTYLGGIANDYGQSIAVDQDGQVHITGYTDSDDFPVINAYQALRAGNIDSYVAKLSRDGSSLLYSTYLGGSDGDDKASDIALDVAGNAYVVGSTDSSNYPLNNAYQLTRSADLDGFISKLNNTGNTLIYSTYLGGEGRDTLNAIAVDTNGQAHVIGTTEPLIGTPLGSEFPVINAVQLNYGGGPSDAIVAQLNNSGNTLNYATYLGGLQDDTGNDITVDDSDQVYVIGTTGSSDLPATMTLIQTAYAGGDSDAYFARYDVLGGLDYFGYVGGEGEDSGLSIQIDAQDTVYLGGRTNSQISFPLDNSLQVYGGDPADTFLLVLTEHTGHFFSTYLGGLGDESGTQLALDDIGNVTLVGLTTSVDFPVVDAVQALHGGGTQDAFITRINTQVSTKLTGTGADDLLIGSMVAELIKGQAGNDDLEGGDGDDILTGGTGNDSLNGEGGNDVLIGGAGNDWLSGENGNDVYKFALAWGQDIISNNDYLHSTDTIRFGIGISPSDISVSRVGDSLFLNSVNSTDSIEVIEYFRIAAFKIDRIEFVDGTVWDQTILEFMAGAPVVSISAPIEGASFNEGDAIQFTATAIDAVDGDLSAAIQWQSSQDGVLGSGSSIVVSTLSANNHLITASVTDSDVLIGIQQVNIIVNSTVDTTPPTVPDLNLINRGNSAGGIVMVTGLPGAVEPGALLHIQNIRDGLEVLVLVQSDGSFNTDIAAFASDDFTLFAVDAAGNQGASVTLIPTTALSLIPLAIEQHLLARQHALPLPPMIVVAIP